MTTFAAKNTSESSSKSEHPNEKLAQFLWTGFILSFFLIQAVIWTFAISITATDSSHAVIADYDQKAIDWDKNQELRRSSQRLGWAVKLDVAADGDIMSRRELTLRLADKNGHPIQNAVISVDAFHRARAANKQSLEFEESDPGIYRAVIEIRKSGQWQFSGNATLGQNVFLIEDRQSIQLVRK